MKKVLATIAMASALAACNKTTVEYEQTGAITFRPVAETPMGKAVTGPISTGYNQNESFKVYAWHKIDGLKGGEDWNAFFGDGTGVAKWIDNGTFSSNGTGNQWAGSPTAYYWPKTGYLMFAGYSPADIVNTGALQGTASATSAEYTIGTTPEFNITGFQQGSWTSSDKSNMVDLMWFNINDTDSKAVNNATNGATVPVKFHHTLSWLTFKFETKETSAFFLTEAKLTKVNTKGDFKGSKTSAVWSMQSSPQDYILYGNETGTDLISAVTADNILAVPFDFTNAQAGEYEIAIKFKQGGADQLVQSVTLALNTLNNKVWESGKHYTYTIKMSANPIILEPQVDNWNNGNGGDININ